MILAPDAMNVFAATIAEHLRQPAEKNLYVHVLWLQELLDRGVVSQLMWTDTRCMCADGLTKGSIDREGLHEVMRGLWRITHAVKLWSAPIRKYDPKQRNQNSPFAHRYLLPLVPRSGPQCSCDCTWSMLLITCRA